MNVPATTQAWDTVSRAFSAATALPATSESDGGPEDESGEEFVAATQQTDYSLEPQSNGIWLRRTSPTGDTARDKIFIRFPLNELKSIGRNPKLADIPLGIDVVRKSARLDQFTSGIHGFFFTLASGLYYVDSSSTGSTYNGETIVGSVAKETLHSKDIPSFKRVGPLKKGDTIEFGRDNTRPGPTQRYDGVV